MTDTAPPAPAAVAAGGPAGSEREPRRRLTGWDLLVLVGANAVAVVGLWWRQGGISEIHDTAGLLTSLGRVTGMVGALLALLQLVLLARLPVLDRLALDRVNGWHRWNGIVCVALLVAHTVLITVGYALADEVGLVREIGDLLGDYSGVLIATIGLVLLVAAAVTSARAARRRLGRRAWHAIHLTVYAAVALAFSHQLATGHEFQRQPVARAYWWALYGATVLAIVAFRLVRPTIRSLAVHGLHVTRVASAEPGVVTVEVGGDGLDRLGARAGQYLYWRFLAAGHRWRSRALSLSAAPRDDVLRVTVRERAGARPSLASLRPGTRVIAEGPAGGLTSASRRRPGLAVIAGGPGIAPARALLEATPGEVVVVCTGARETAPLGPEVDDLARERGAALRWVAPDTPLTGDRLAALVPDLAARDVFVAGPSDWVGEVRVALRAAGITDRQVWSEGFG